jgi:hypothetical protein
MILYLSFLKRRKNDFAYHGMQSKNILANQNHIYSQNVVVRNEACISTHLKAMNFKDINVHEANINKNISYLNFILWVISKDRTKLDINIIKNPINCCVLNDSPNKRYHSASDMGATI